MTRTSSAPADARSILRVDATFEAILAMGCLVLVFRFPTLGAWATPTWLGRPLLIVLVVILAAAAGVLHWLSARADANTLRAVAAANGITAVALLAWASLSAELGIWPRSVLVFTTAVLVALAGAQLNLARRQ